MRRGAGGPLLSNQRPHTEGAGDLPQLGGLGGRDLLGDNINASDARKAGGDTCC